jgi:hypothetical protein
VTTASVKDTSDSETDNADEHLKVNRINEHSPYKYDYEKYRVDEVSIPTDHTICSESVNEESLNDSVPTVPSRYVSAPLLNDTIHPDHEESVKKKTFGDILRNILTHFDVEIFRNVAYCMFLVSTFLYSLGYYIPYIYLPDTAKEAGKLF